MKKRIVSLVLTLALLIGMMPMITIEADALTQSSYAPYASIEYSYSESVECGTIRYISQIPSDSYFNWDYWPASYFGGYSTPKKECGTACISMALSYIGINKTPDDILSANNGYTHFDECGEATHTSLSASAITTAMDNYINGDGKYSPPVIHIPGYSSAGHYVVVIGKISENTYEILDPAERVVTKMTINGTSAQYTKGNTSISDTINELHQWYNPKSVGICNHSDYYKDCGVCSACGYVFDWESTFSAEAMGTYTITKAGTPRTDKPYDAATKASYELVVGKEVTVLGSYTNAYGSTWYKFTDASGEIAYIYEDYLSFADYLKLEVTCSGFSPAEASVLPPETYPVQGTVISNYPLKSIDAYLNGEYYASWTASNQTTTSVSLRSTDINYKLDFSSLSDGGYIITLMANDFANPTSIKFFSSSFDIQSESSDACTHSYGDWVTVTAATCTTNGTQRSTCTLCGNVREQTISASGHSYADGLCSVCGAWDPDYAGNHIQFDVQGGDPLEASDQHALDGINIDRAAKYLVIYNQGGELCDTNQYGVEIAVNGQGEIVQRRWYGDTEKIYIPEDGFIVSASSGTGSYLEGIADDAYIGYDEDALMLYVYDSKDAYVANHKYVASWDTYGYLPTPTKTDAVFYGWFTQPSGGTQVTESSTYSVDTLYARWECDHSYTTQVIAPTCTASGYTSHICGICGDSYTDTVTPATGHAYAYQVTAEPTTVSTGTLTGTCASCSATTTVTLPVLNTTDYTFHVLTEATCTEKGRGSYVWNNIEYASVIVEVDIPLAAHVYSSLYSSATCVKYAHAVHTCVDCGYSYTEEFAENGFADHKYVEKIVAPTCTASGYTSYTCSVCGDSYTDTTTPATGHTYSCTVTTEPTKTTEGLLTGSCGTCGETLSITLPVLSESDYDYTLVQTPTAEQTGIGQYTWHETAYGEISIEVEIAATANTSSYYTYTLSGNEATITAVSSDLAGDVVIPSSLDGYPVVAIGNSVFKSNTNITGVVIPDSVTTIGNYAFANSGIRTLTIGENVTSIGNYAFFGCSVLTKVTIPDSVITIGECAFTNSGIRTLTIGENVTSIGDYAFSGCSLLTEVTIPDAVTSMGQFAFSNCTSLSTATIGDGVTYIRYWAFKGCTNLESVSIGASVVSIASEAFKDCTSLRVVTGNAALERIYEKAFANCSSLTSITFSDSIANILSYAFNDCTGLTDVYYAGSEADWESVGIGTYNDPLLNATIHYNYTGETEVLYGDVNSDGKVNAQDRLYLTRYLAGMTGYTEDMIDLTAADVNCDGKVNTQDRMILTRYLAQWTAYPELPYGG